MRDTIEASPAAPAQPARTMIGAGKRALVLAGGGIGGFLYEVGALTALEEAGPWGWPDGGPFEMYVGTSAGAVLAALLANGARPSAIFEAISQNRRESPFYFRQSDVLGVSAGGALRLAGQFVRAMLGTIAGVVRARQWPGFAGLLSDFQERHPPGFYSTEPLQATLCERFGVLGYHHHFGELGRQLYITAADIDTGEPVVFGDGDEFEDLHICRAVAASCALPIFFRPIRIGQRDLVDGAVAPLSPIEIAAERGASQILFVNPLVPIRNDRSRLCLPLHDHRCARLAEKGVSWIGEQALRLMATARNESALKCLRQTRLDIEIAIIEPGRDEIAMFMQNVVSFSVSKELLTYGRQSARNFLLADRAPEELAAAHP